MFFGFMLKTFLLHSLHHIPIMLLFLSPSGPAPHDCSEWCQKGFSVNGVYEINPDGQGTFEVYCDMKTNGGGKELFVFFNRLCSGEKKSGQYFIV